jgi:hypothetical protein
VKAQLEDFIRHAESYGCDGVYEAAVAGGVESAALAALAGALAEVDPTWRRPNSRNACRLCGAPLEASRSDAAWCSPACRQKAYRRRGKT